jgi:ribosomal protein L11 methyltransferase
VNQFPAWIEVRLVTPGTMAEIAADYVYQLTGRGVEIKEWGPPGGPAEVLGYLSQGAEAAALRRSLEKFADQLRRNEPDKEVHLKFNDLPGQDWGANWKKHFHPMEVVRGLIVAPSWERPKEAENKRILLIDPGQAFGTGQHQTTILCLKRIARLTRYSQLPAKVLDVGCGTGILSLAALAYGAKSAVAIDLDPEAIKAARENARVNGFEGMLETSLTPLNELDETFPLILANLTAGEVRPLIPDLVKRLDSGGELVVSGLLPEQVEEIQGLLEEAGLARVELNSLSGWRSLVMS